MSAPHVAERRAAYTLQTAMEPALGASFDLLATAPQGVAKLRELILSLAVRGKLVQQWASDKPETNILSWLTTEKKPRSNGRSKKRSATGAECPFDIPSSWIWVDLSDVTYSHGQETPSSEFTYIDVASIDNERGCVKNEVQVLAASDAPSRARKLVKKDAVIYSTVRPYLKNIAIIERDYSPAPIASTAFAIMQPREGLLPKYLFFYLRSAEFTEFVASRMLGVAYPAINDANFFEGKLPLPPLAEQARIVARVEELMQLCDALEAHGRLQDEQHARLVVTLFDTLAASESAEALAENWQRLATHFDVLLDRPEAVDTLEQTLLQLAVRGLLVPQYPTDEPASELLDRIRAEKNDLVTLGQRKPQKSIPLIDDGEKPFEIRSGWCWARLEGICEEVVDCPHSTAKFVESGVLCIDTNSFKSWKLIPHKLRYVTEQTYDERIARLAPVAGDLVFAREGVVGESVLIPEGTRCCLGQRVMLFRFSPGVFNMYVQMAISSKEFLGRLLALHKGIGAKHVNVADMRAALIPLPPLAEQHRIVARVEQLRGLCAELRERLQQSRATQSRLADALVSQAASSAAC